MISGLLAGSIALVGFGLDSLIEVASGTALLWRLRRDQNVAGREKAERLTLRIVGLSFLLLAAYVAYESLDSLITAEAPKRSVPGIIIAAASLIVMPLLARAKRQVGAQISSVAMAADARKLIFACISQPSAGRIGAERTVWIVVDGPGCRFDHGSDHRPRRRQCVEGQDLLRIVWRFAAVPIRKDHPMPAKFDPRFAAVAEAFANDPLVEQGTMMSSHGLRVNGKIFGMFGRGQFVAKLPKRAC